MDAPLPSQLLPTQPGIPTLAYLAGQWDADQPAHVYDWGH